MGVGKVNSFKYPSKNKYKAKKFVDEYGNTFDSKKEYKRWLELVRMQEEGLVNNLERQVKYILIPSQKALVNGKMRVIEREAGYIADFVYQQNGETVVEDVKGYRGGGAYAIFTIKRKLMLEKYNIRIKEI